MLGYWREPELTAQVLRDGWLHTGDLGHVDGEGFLYIDGRAVEMIKVGAFRVSPQEVEEVLATFPGVEEVAVTGVADDVLGQSIKAVIVLREGDAGGLAWRQGALPPASGQLQSAENRRVRRGAAAHRPRAKFNVSNWLKRISSWPHANRSMQKSWRWTTMRVIEHIARACAPSCPRTWGVAASCVAMSGGIDSSVSSALCVKALGKDKVYGLMLPERDSSGFSTARGRQLAEHLGIKYEVFDIAPALEGIGCYKWRDDAIRKVFPEYGDGWKNKIVISGGLEGQINHFQLVVQTPDGRDQTGAPRPARNICRSSPRPITSSASARRSSISMPIV